MLLILKCKWLLCNYLKNSFQIFSIKVRGLAVFRLLFSLLNRWAIVEEESWNWLFLPLTYTLASCLLTPMSLTHNWNVFSVTNSCNSPIITLCCPTVCRFSYQEHAAKSWTAGLDLLLWWSGFPCLHYLFVYEHEIMVSILIFNLKQNILNWMCT